MSALKNILIYMLLFGAFIMAFINGGLLLAAVNSPNNTIGNDPALVEFSSALNSTLEDAYESANGSMTAIESSPVQVTQFAIILDAIGGIWKSLKVVPLAIYNLSVDYVFGKLLGDQQFAIMMGIVGAILIIVLIFAVWFWINSVEDR